jgi:hypothetical protein
VTAQASVVQCTNACFADGVACTNALDCCSLGCFGGPCGGGLCKSKLRRLLRARDHRRLISAAGTNDQPTEASMIECRTNADCGGGNTCLPDYTCS